jgi:hypothetical protein
MIHYVSLNPSQPNGKRIYSFEVDSETRLAVIQITCTSSQETLYSAICTSLPLFSGAVGTLHCTFHPDQNEVRNKSRHGKCFETSATEGDRVGCTYLSLTNATYIVLLTAGIVDFMYDIMGNGFLKIVYAHLRSFLYPAFVLQAKPA